MQCAIQYRQLSAAQVHRMRLDRINMLQPALCIRIIQDACIELGLCNPNQIVRLSALLAHVLRVVSGAGSETDETDCGCRTAHGGFYHEGACP